jgi:hypothetical protein
MIDENECKQSPAAAILDCVIFLALLVGVVWVFASVTVAP